MTVDTIMADNAKMLSIDDVVIWRDWIIENADNRMDNKSGLSERGFDIVAEANNLSEKYLELSEK